jgi:hypothetical protein
MKPIVLRHGEPGKLGIISQPAAQTIAIPQHLKLRGATGSQLPTGGRPGELLAAAVGPRDLAWAIASHTVDALLEAKMLDPASAAEQLRVYGASLGEERLAGQGILRCLFPEEDRLAQAVRHLNDQAHRHVWEIAHRITPPESFYKAHPEIVEVCKLCGAVILDAATLSTMTTGSINPLAGDFLAQWIQSALEHDAFETRPRFFFHVVVPPRHWPALIRAHFRNDHGI